MALIYRILFVILLVVVNPFTSVVLAQSEAPLRVYTKPIEPFVMKESNEGFSMDLLKALMKQLNFGEEDYEIVRVEGVQDVLSAVQNNLADLGIAAITINSSREEKVDFSQPMFDSGLQIMISSKHKSGGWDLELLKPLVKVFGMVLLVMLVASHIVWLLERKKNPDFREGYLQGVWDAFWWSAVTVTTVGYGDKSPKSFFGRVMGIIWMFSGLFLIAFFTSSITSTLTVARLQGSINGPSDLYDKNVAVIQETTSHSYLKSLNIEPNSYKTVQEMYDALDKGEVEAVVYDAPVLQYFVATQGAGKFEMVGEKFKVESYGIALPKGSPLLDRVNVGLLQLKENGTYTELLQKWFGVSE